MTAHPKSPQTGKTEVVPRHMTKFMQTINIETYNGVMTITLNRPDQLNAFTRTMMQEMVAERTSMSLVVNEYGDPLGIATMEDLVETLLGMEIVDESDSHIDMQERARELWRLRAKTAGLSVDAINAGEAE